MSYPTMPPQPPMQAPPTPPRNGFGITALVLAIVAAVFAFVPVFGAFLAIPLAVLAVVFGALGYVRTRKGQATNPAMSLTGLILGAVAFVLAIVVTVATAVAVDDALSGQGGAVQPTTAAEPADSSAEPDAQPAAPSTAKVGDTWEYEDGLEVTVTKLTRRSISDVAAGGRPGEPMAVATVKITNNSDQNLGLFDVFVVARAGNAGNEAEQVFDEGIDGFSEGGTLTPGRSATAKFGFAVKEKNLDDVTIEVTPGFDYEPAIFEGGIR